MKQKQATVRVADPDLLAECSELLERQIGQKLPQAHVRSAGLTALKNQHVHELITKDDCRHWGLQAAICTTAESIELLISCGLLESGEYRVVPHKDRGIEILKEGEPLREPNEKPVQHPGMAMVN